MMSSVVSLGHLDLYYSELRAYRDAASRSTREYLDRALSEIPGDLTDGDIASLRELGVEAIRESALVASGNISLMTSDYIAAITGSELSSEVIDGSALVTWREHVSEYVDSLVNEVMNGELTVRQYVARCSERADREVAKSHARALDRLVRDDGVRWARVAVGKSCDWCIMHSSRGYCYKSAKSAMAPTHSSCDCKIVPNRIGERDVIIAGYDPDALYRQWVGRIKKEAIDNGCKQRAQREKSVSKHIESYSSYNLSHAINSLLPNPKRTTIAKNGKIRYISDSASLQVIVDAINGYFRVIDVAETGGFMYRDIHGLKVDGRDRQRLTHFLIEGFHD